MDRTYISRLERGKILPRYPAMIRLAESLGVSVADLVRHPPCLIDRMSVTDVTRSQSGSPQLHRDPWDHWDAVDRRQHNG